MKRRGVCAVVYDDAGVYFFLIVRRASQDWEFPFLSVEHEGELSEDEEKALLKTLLLDTLGLQKAKVAAKLPHQRYFMDERGEHEIVVYLVESSMNSPVQLSSDRHESYLWAKGESVEEKIVDTRERDMFREIMVVLNA